MHILLSCGSGADEPNSGNSVSNSNLELTTNSKYHFTDLNNNTSHMTSLQIITSDEASISLFQITFTNTEIWFSHECSQKSTLIFKKKTGHNDLSKNRH